jgi:hypothetical protein
MTPVALLGWGFMAITIAVFADIPATSDVAVAFAYLILLAVLFHSGAKVFDGLSAALATPQPKTVTAPGYGPGGINT